MFKKALVFLWKLPRTIFNTINECEENFLRKFDENYESKLAKNSIIYCILFQAISSLSFFIYRMIISTDMNLTLGIILTLLPLITFVALYTYLYLKKRLPLIQGRKWWYCIQATLGLWFGFYVVIAPLVILGGLLYVAFIVVVIILIIWIALSVMTADSSGSRDKKRWKLENGDEVVEDKDLLGGTSTYRDRYDSSKTYTKEGDKFRENPR